MLVSRALGIQRVIFAAGGGLRVHLPRGVDFQIGVGVVLGVNSVRDSAVWICSWWRA